MSETIRVMLVEDHAVVRQGLAALLGVEDDLEVVGAVGDGLAAIEMYRQQKPDVVLMDLQMPVMGGHEATRALRDLAGAEQMPVIALTAQPAHKLRALQAGARDFINKPFEFVEVELRIHHVLEMHLLHKQLEAQNRDLERLVQERTAALQESEARYRSLTELAADWYWEQNEAGTLTRMSGPIQELFSLPGLAETGSNRWNAEERQILQDNIEARRTFLDLLVHCHRPDGSQQQFRVSGEPIFDRTCRFVGYRGLGVEDRAYR